MTISLESLSKYLGMKATMLLGEPPFSEWAFTRSVDDDLAELRINYVCETDGIDVVCDKNEDISTIFLHADELRHLSEDVEDMPFESSRQEVLTRLGAPSKSGERYSDPILGEYGEWDRFARPGYAIHIEYGIDEDVIRRITLMRADVVP